MLEDILARQLYGGNGWRISDERQTADGIEVYLVPTRMSAVCSGCGKKKPRCHDTKHWARRWRHRGAWGIETVVIAPLRRVRCRFCGIRTELVPWARTGSRFTHGLEAEILDRARESSIQGVSRQLRVHWTTVMRLIEGWVRDSADRHFRRPLRRIGVDEVSYGRGRQKYLTVVWDHDRGQVVWIGKGRERDTLDQFFVKLGPRRARRLVCVTMDMAQGYISAVKHHAEQAEIVFDRFHIERHLTEAVNEVRKHEFWRRRGFYRDAIRGKKFLLLKHRRRLHWRRRRELDELLRINRNLNWAYVVKEAFQQVWKYKSTAGMRDALDRWRFLLRWRRLRPLNAFWRMLERHMHGVLAWAKHHMTNAALEGNNSLVRGLSQRAHGYRNPDNFILILYHHSWR